MVVRIWAKLSDFVREYSRNLCCELYCNNGDGSIDTALWTLNFSFSSEHAVAHWIFTNNKSNFAQLFINSSNVSVINVRFLRFILYLNRVFIMSVPTCCTNTRLKSVAKWYNLPYQWTHEANYSVLATKLTFSSAWCWPALHGMYLR